MLFANVGYAATYTETGDAGDLPATAQIVSGTAGTALTSLSGALTLTNAISDSDMFEINISNPGAFSAATTAFVAGANNFDTQLAVFTLTGAGVVTNDDAANGGSQSSIAAGSPVASFAAGNYYLLISGSGRYAVSSGGLIFPNYTDGTTDPTGTPGAVGVHLWATDPTGTYGPTGPGGTGVISGYSGNSNEAGNYVIALTGAQFVPAVVVPEPGAYACVLVGAAGLVLITRIRRTAK